MLYLLTQFESLVETPPTKRENWVGPVVLVLIQGFDDTHRFLQFHRFLRLSEPSNFGHRLSEVVFPGMQSQKL